MNTKEQVLKKIKEIKEQYGSKPQCYLVAVILCSNFKGHMWYDHNHCVTLIDEEFYDKEGVVPLEVIEEGNYLPINVYGMDSEKALMDALIKTKGSH